jgi:hypothetical protein
LFTIPDVPQLLPFLIFFFIFIFSLHFHLFTLSSLLCLSFSLLIFIFFYNSLLLFFLFTNPDVHQLLLFLVFFYFHILLAISAVYTFFVAVSSFFISSFFIFYNYFLLFFLLSITHVPQFLPFLVFFKGQSESHIMQFNSLQETCRKVCFAEAYCIYWRGADGTKGPGVEPGELFLCWGHLGGNLKQT